jgi:hypothetical protein
MKKKVLRVEACPFFNYIKNGKTEGYKNELQELFLEYKRGGMKSKEAWEKAKTVLDSFGRYL